MKKLEIKLTPKQWVLLREMLAYAVKAAQSMTWEKTKDYELLERHIIGQVIRQQEGE